VRSFETAGTPSEAGAKFCSVNVRFAVVVAAGAGTVIEPLNPCELGRGSVVGPLPGVSVTGIDDVVTVQNGDSPVWTGTGFVPPP
jgi:hypothetical protein